eukprot:7062918-Pyramimonas_sp.AAC.1
MMGLDAVVVEWLLGASLDVITQVNDARRAVRLCGKGQHDAQARATGAYSPVRVTGMAKQIQMCTGVSHGPPYLRRVWKPMGLWIVTRCEQKTI